MSERIRVLHVDDEPDFAELTATALEREADRFAVDIATCADEGLDRLGDDVACIVSDYDMPDTSGIQFLETVREDYPDLPFILFTGNGSEAVASDAISAGVTDYVQKRGVGDRFAVLANRIVNAVEQYRTEQRLRRREYELKRQNNRLYSLFENFPEPTFGYVYEDGEPYIAFVNEAFAEVFGYGDEEAVGEHVDDLIVPPKRREEAKRIDDRVKDGESVDEVLRRRTREGVRDFRFRNIRLPDDEDIDGYAIYADITELKERERELERQNVRLEEFADVVSHDLRNPLSVAAGRLDLAQEECESEHLYDVAGAIDRCRTLIDDLLTLAREGDDVSEFGPVELAASVEDCWRAVDTAEATLVVDTDRSILADHSRLQQLLENIVRNAVEHSSTSPDSGIREDDLENGDADVTVTVGVLDDGFYVADDGPGIPRDERDTVFEGGYSTRDAGTGFGLSIVAEIVEAHDWTIDVTDSQDGGARFEIRGVEFGQ